MKLLASIFLLFWLIVLAGGCARQEANAMPASQSAALAPSWAGHCTLDGIQFQEEGEREFLAHFANRCGAQDACVLACLRSGCAYGIGGGCFHACALRGAPPGKRDALLLREAAAYRAGTNYFCRSRKQEAR